MVSANPLPAGVTIQAQPLFETATDDEGVRSPLQLTISSQGSALSGRITAPYLGDEGAPIVVDIPPGGTKRYVLGDDYSRPGTEVEFTTNRGRFTFEAPGRDTGDPFSFTRLFLLITDSVGGFTWPPAAGQRFAFCLASTAPTRVDHYQSASTILLGQGTDQLSDAAIEALRLFTLGGGTLIFLGTPGGAAVDDPRWKGLNPISGRQPTTFSNPGNLGVGGKRLAGPVRGYRYVSLAPGATGVTLAGQPAMAAQPYGHGLSIFFGLDPRDPVISSWDRRGRLFTAVAGPRRVGGAHAKWTISKVEDMITGDAATARALENLPSGATMWWSFLAFAILVGPINFLILQRLKRQDWAWVTSPLIAAAFAGFFFYQARELYKLPATAATAASVVGSQGDPNTLAWTTTGLFFPRAGEYDLDIRQVTRIDEWGSESERSTGSYPYNVFRSASPLPAIDVGQLQVIPVEVPNLSFRQFTYGQILSDLRIVSARWEPDGTLVVKNETSAELTDIRLESSEGDDLAKAKPLAPGASMRLRRFVQKPPASITFRSGWQEQLPTIWFRAVQSTVPTAPKGSFTKNRASATRIMIQIENPTGGPK